MFSYFGTRPVGRPPVLPLARAAVNPNLVRSRRTFRSCSANTQKICTIIVVYLRFAKEVEHTMNVSQEVFVKSSLNRLFLRHKLSETFATNPYAAKINPGYTWIFYQQRARREI